MILNGLSVAASLMKKGEDPALNRADFASLYNVTKRDLTAARELTGCYSLTRFHLNKAAQLLGVKPTDFVYRVSPALLKTDGTGKVEVSGADAQSLGATNLDPNVSYTASVTNSADTDSMILDLAGAALGGDFVPKDAQSRFDLLKEAASQNGGSLVAAMMGTLEQAVFVRYNAGSFEKIADDLSYPVGIREQAAGIAHLTMAIYGAASTGAALGMLRMYLGTGVMFNYNEPWELRKWLRSASSALMGTRSSFPANEVKPNAKFDSLADAAAKCRTVYSNSPYVKDMVFGISGNNAYASETMTKSVASYIEFLGTHLNKRQTRGEYLDVDALVSKANKLLAMTPQLIRKQA